MHDCPKCGLSATARQLELHKLRRATLEVVKRAFEAAGVEFIDANNGGAGGEMPANRALRVGAAEVLLNVTDQLLEGAGAIGSTIKFRQRRQLRPDGR